MRNHQEKTLDMRRSILISKESVRPCRRAVHREERAVVRDAVRRVAVGYEPEVADDSAAADARRECIAVLRRWQPDRLAQGDAVIAVIGRLRGHPGEQERADA